MSNYIYMYLFVFEYLGLFMGVVKTPIRIGCSGLYKSLLEVEAKLICCLCHKND